MTRWRAGLTVAAMVCWAGSAQAEPETHDGFQFRGTLGGGYLHDSESLEGTPVDFERSVSGAAALVELYLGGTPVPGLVLGGFLSGMSAPNPKAKFNGASVGSDDDATLGLGSIGPYVDYYPDVQGGLHVLGTLGYGLLSFDDGSGNGDDATSSETSSGFTLGAGIGYDAFVSDEWSLGALARLSYGWTSHGPSAIPMHDDVLMFGLSFSVSCH